MALKAFLHFVLVGLGVCVFLERCSAVGLFSPTPSASFPGIEGDGAPLLANVHGAVGREHLLTIAGNEIRIQNRNGEDVDPNANVPIETFWDGLGAVEVWGSKVVYDPYAGRWILVSVAGFVQTNVNPGLLIAVSQGEDPTAGWDRHFIDVDETESVYLRSLNIGFNQHWVAVQGNVFNQSTSAFLEADVFIFGRTNLYAGDASAMTRVSVDTGGVQKCPVPAVTYSETQPTLYLVSNFESNLAGRGFLRVWTISGPVDAPVLNPGQITGQFQPAFTAWDDFAPDDGNFGPQSGSNEKVHLGDARIAGVVFRNGSLWLAHTVFQPAGNPTASSIQWVEMTPGALVIQRGIISAAGDSYAFPSVAVSRFNDTLIGYSRFSSSHHPLAGYSFRMERDVFGVVRGERFFKLGEGVYVAPDNGGVNRWGNSSAAVVDPVDDGVLWTVQQYAEIPEAGEGRWGSWWAQVGGMTIRYKEPGLVVISSSTGTTGFSLEARGSLSPGDPWLEVPVMSSLIDGEWVVEIPVDGAMRVFRMVR